MLGVLTLFTGLLLVRKGKSLIGWRTVYAALVYFFIVSLPITSYLLGHAIERNYQEVPAAEMPDGDVVLNFGNYYERSWYAAELVKAGKAKIMIASGRGMSGESARLMRDLGVGSEFLVIENEARNTEENVKLSRELAQKDLRLATILHPRVLVVTSAAHMPRCMLLMKRFWPEAEAIPSPCNFISNEIYSHGFHWGLLKPKVSALADFESFFHEVVGWVYYRCFR